jgi:hypothetical protein
MAQATDPTASQQQAGVAAPLSTPNDVFGQKPWALVGMAA